LAFQTIRGESGVDFIGTDNVDILLSLNEAGDQTVDALGGNDNITLENTAGVVGTATVKGGAGNDTIVIGGTSNQGITRISGSILNGGLGDDILTSQGAVTSTIRGNEGQDTINLAGNYTSSKINGGAGGDIFALTAAVQLENTKILGGNDNDGAINLSGQIITAVNSTVNGSKGVDTITLGGAAINATGFTVFGGQGDDFINAAAMTAASDGVTFSGDDGNDQIQTATADDLIFGGEGNDIITTTGGANTIDGGAGDDQLTGGAAADSIDGGEGNDTIVDADALANTINGGEGNDSITVGLGADEITGGLGRDTYIDATGTYQGSTDYNIGLSDSNAVTTGVTTTFDRFVDLFGGASTVDIDLTSALSNQLAGSNVTNAGVNTGAAIATIAIADENNGTGVTFAEIKTAVDAAALTASGNGGVNAYIITVAGQTAVNGVTMNGVVAAATAVDYVLLNNTNTILDAGDSMFQVSAGDGANVIAAIDLN